MAQMTQANPNLWGIIGDLLVKNMDWPGADEMAKRMKATIPPEIRQDEEEEQELPPEVIAQFEQLEQAYNELQAQLQAVGQENEELQSVIDGKVIEKEIKERDADVKMAEIEHKENELSLKESELAVKAAEIEANLEQSDDIHTTLAQVVQVVQENSEAIALLIASNEVRPN